jgi:putative inorganic carbon (HCO3(-)) transporter
VSGELLAGAGVLCAVAGAAIAILSPPSRLRSAAMLAAVALPPVLVLGDQWDSSRVVDLRGDTGRLLALGGAATAAGGALFAVFRRWPLLLPVAVIAALPFRIPLHSGGAQANLLVPLYLVIAAGVAFVVARDWKQQAAGPAGGTNSVTGPAAAPLWLPRVLAAFVALYGLQVLYSEDFSQGLQNVCFFLAPFSLVFVLFADVRWDRRLIRWMLAVVAAEALVFALIGFVEYASRDLLWNNAVIRSNEFHVYFRVNSLFWDPNVFGRYMALAIVLLVAALLWTRHRRTAMALAGATVVIWLGLATTYSQSSFAALIAGLAVLAALRWSMSRTALACGAGIVVAAAVALAAGESLEVDLSTDSRVNKETGGRANLVSGGIELFGERPLLGYGSGSFSTAFRESVEDQDPPVSESHTEPITVAAEQGVVGLAVYSALLVVALATLWRRMEETMPGLRRGPPETTPQGWATVARAAVLAAFVALVVHTMSYAGFFEDPITWVLLAVGGSLAAMPEARPDAEPGSAATVRAAA